ncbi:hypothetical protein [Streptomyces sp. SID12501]|uniref:Uncharacterized protein n=1 Tax=Streptomyces sp. SID12501 TaxID=2706042 RepID=A0A6B3BQM9_9ACTN|nr:hypothetical protein [Streptomyces sp. SID12501]NEC86649.1 hypothetical protein [Streptomyces sp. SID12501]
MTSPTTDEIRCGEIRASLFYRAPIFSEAGACVLLQGHDGDHRDPRGGTWNVIPLYPMINADRRTHE